MLKMNVKLIKINISDKEKKDKKEEEEEDLSDEDRQLKEELELCVTRLGKLRLLFFSFLETRQYLQKEARILCHKNSVKIEF